MSKTLYVIDGHAQIYRAYYAPFRNLTSPTGEPTRATYVFCQMLLNLLRDRKPDYLAMALDSDPAKLERTALFPEYKAQREPPPEDMAPQEERIIGLLEQVGVPLLRLEGYEADDIMATLAARLASPELQVFLVSRDKDLDQLLTDHVSMFDPLKAEVITPASLKQTKGWTPAQAVEAQILTGDTSDNVPGVPGIGPKTAAKLLEKYGSVAEIVAHADELSPKQRQNVLAFEPQIDLVRQLVTLQSDVPLSFELDQAACARQDWSRTRPVFIELGFRKLLDQLPEAAEAVGDAPSVEVQTPDASTGDNDPLRTPEGGDYQLVNTPDALRTLAKALAQQPEYALDTETTGIHAMDCDLVGISFSWEVGRGWFVPLRSAFGQVLSVDEVRESLGPVLADERICKVGQHLKYDLNVLRNAGLPVAGPLFDTMVAAFLVHPGLSSYGLDKLALGLLGHQMIPITDLIGSGKNQIPIDQTPLDRLCEYACEDADYTWRLRQLLEAQLEPAGVARLFRELEMPLVRVLTDMEFNGIRLDADLLAERSEMLATRTAGIATRIHELAETDFNIDSPKQLAEVLFDKLGFRVVRRTKTTRSTDADTLATLARETGHEIFELLLEYREIQKLRGTYVDALPRERSRRTGRIHTSYHQTGTVTGRLSSSAPNLQNIPVRTEIGREIRRAFVPREPGEVLIVADYSQIELRVLAHYCQDEALIRAFVEDQDIHAFVAAQINNVPLEEVTKEQRGRAKAVNFGIVYGQTAFGLAQATGMPRGEAQAFIDAYFERYPRIREFIDECLASARRDGYVRTILGRRRPIEQLDSRNANARAQAERFAVNTVIQGSAADLIKTAMIRLDERVRTDELPLRMLLQVHDELVCEGPREQVEMLADVIREAMGGAMELRVPLKVDVGWGDNWLEAK